MKSLSHILIHRRLYDWVIRWAETPSAMLFLLFLAVAESSFFPIPPDVLLIALCLAHPRKSFLLASVCSLGSVLGGMIGYLIGYAFYEVIAEPIIRFYGYQDLYLRISHLYDRYNAWIVGIAGFTPIPYKIVTIAAGALKINFFIFTIASLISRSARFFLISAILWKFGPPVKEMIEKYLGVLTIVFVSLLLLGFLLLKYLL